MLWNQVDALQKHFKKDHVHMRLWTRLYGIAARETLIFSRTFPLRSITILLLFLPLRRPSFSKFLYVKAFHRRPRPAYYTLELAPEPPFSLCRGIYLPKFGVSAPPPPTKNNRNHERWRNPLKRQSLSCVTPWKKILHYENLCYIF